MKFLNNIFKKEGADPYVPMDINDNYLVCLCDKEGNVVSIASYAWVGKKEEKSSVLLPINIFISEEEASECIKYIEDVILNKVKDKKEREDIAESAKERFRVGLWNMYFAMHEDVLGNIDNGDYSLEVLHLDKDLKNKEGVSIKDLYTGQGEVWVAPKIVGSGIIVNSVIDYNASISRKLSMVGQDMSDITYCIALGIKGKLAVVSFLCEKDIEDKDGKSYVKIKKFKTHKEVSDCADILEQEILYNPDNDMDIANKVGKSLLDNYGCALGSVFSMSKEARGLISDGGPNLVILHLNSQGDLITTKRDGSRGSVDFRGVYVGGEELSEDKNHLIFDADRIQVL